MLSAVVYAMIDIPAPNEAARSRSVVVEWRDGSTMATLGDQKRFPVKLSSTPEHLQQAVLAAENREFYDQPFGISPTGIVRAVWRNLTGDDLQGGSTITQQYAQTMYLEQERSFTVKFKELFLTLKLEQNMSKREILEGYLNTIYFGRGGTYGVEAAAREYFGSHANELDAAESAFLAAVLNSPGRYDPAGGPRAKQAAVDRWHYVVSGMVERGWLSRAKAAELSFPQVRSPSDKDTYGGPRGYVLQRVKAELQALGYTEEDIFARGLTVRTTLNPSMQRAAARAVEDTLPSDWNYQRVETGLISMEPETGKVLALYGGRDYLKDQFGNVYQAKTQPGSSFKPYVLAAALGEGIGLNSRFNGNSPQTFADGYEVRNAGRRDYGMINLLGATKHSVNVVYAKLGLEVGISNVTDAATDAGLPSKALPSDLSLALGTASVRPIDQLAGIASFAAEGKYAKPHLIGQVRDSSGEVLREVEADTQRAFSRDVAADVAHAMQQVTEPGGTGGDAALAGRPTAGKTGTSQGNRSAWFVGYTPRVATAVAMFNNNNDKLTNVPGYGTLSGPNAPVDVWHAYMAEVMQGRPVRQFPEPAWVGSALNPAPTPTPSPSVSETGSPSPTPTPTAEPTTPEGASELERDCYPFCDAGAQDGSGQTESGSGGTAEPDPGQTESGSGEGGGSESGSGGNAEPEPGPTGPGAGDDEESG